MNKYDVKAQRMHDHLARHPADYQTIISLFKIKSHSFVYEQQKKRNLMMKEIAKYKREERDNGK